MAYNPIAPTSSRENRKPPATLPQNVIVVIDADGDYALALGTGAEADAYLAVAGGELVIQDEPDGSARAVHVAGTILAMEGT